MEKLATELLLEILDLACADDIFAPRSLSLVSRGVHQASRPFRFRAISLYATARNLQSLIHAIEDERTRSPGMLPKCCRLFLECPNLSAWGLGTTPSDALTFTSLGERSSGVFSYSNSGRAENGWNQWAEHLSSLLCILAPDLETFTLVACSHPDGPIVLPCPFPALRELTVAACGFPLDFSATIGHRECFSSLRRFHLVLLDESEKSPGDLAILAPHAPKLTHLRISHLPRQHNPTALTRLYGKDRPYTAFPDLERVLIQPVPLPERCGPAMMYCEFVTRLWCSAQRARVPVYLIPGGVKLQGANHNAFAQKAKEEWQDRIEGGEGCWAVKEDWVNRSEIGHVVPWHLIIGQR